MSLQASLSERLARLELDCPVLPASLAAPGRADGADLLRAAAAPAPDAAAELDAVAVLSSN